MYLILKLNFLIGLLLFSILSFAGKIEKIEINGLNTISRGTVLNYITMEVGDEISSNSLRDSYSSLSKTDLFSDINLYEKDKKLVIELKENPTIKFIEFKGYKEDVILSEKIVTDIKQNFKLKPGDVFVKKNVEDLIRELKKLYETNAYFKTTISFSSVLDEFNRIGLEFKITENDRALIEKFEIVGNTIFDDDDILDLFNMGESDFFILNYFTKNDHFSKFKLDSGVKSLETKYHSVGYLDFSIKKLDIKYIESSNKLNIKVSIDEGKEYKVGNISFSGEILEFSQDFLKKYITFSKGESFKRSLVVKDLKSLESFFQNKGFAFAKIDSEVKQNMGALDVNINISLGDIVYISRIEISGNTTTQDDVIRAKLDVIEGQKYSLSDIKESLNNINRSGFFSNVDYQIKRRVDSPDNIDIYLNVEETKTGEISVGLSHSNSTGAAINAGIKQNNILGTGKVFNAAFSNSSAVKELSFYFKDPAFNNQNHTISYGLFDRSTDASNLDASTYTINEKGFIFGYGIPIASDSDIFSELKTANISLTCGTDLLNIYEVTQCNSDDSLDSSFSLTYSQNSLNDAFFPTSGTNSRIESVIGVPFSDFKYYKAGLSYKKYGQIFNDKVLKFSTRFNLASGYGGDDLPFFKRFYEGGSSSIRGFDFNSLGPKYANDKPKGGEVSIISSIGIASKVDILGIDNENMRLIGFVDAGTLSEKVSNFNFNDLRSSIGIQLSWLTPIGPIGINLAQPIIKKSEDKTEVFAFELGAKF